jgi:Ca-activated chloride channel family protein
LGKGFYIPFPRRKKGDVMSGDVDMLCSLNRMYIPPNKGQKLFLKIEIMPQMVAATESLPVNVCLLIDRSGSMAGKKLENAKIGAAKLINQLENRDYAGVVTFESKVDIVVPGQHVTDSSMFEGKIRNIKLGGTTEMYKGLETAFAELKRRLQTHYGTGREPVRRTILLSDGQPTDGRSESEYRRLAREMREIGISITALGIGDDYNEDLLSAIAEDSGGMWYHIDSPDRIPNIFSGELNNMKTVVFSRPELVLHLSHGVELADIYKSKPDVHRISNVKRVDSEYRIPISDIRAGESQTIVARIGVPPRPEGECRVAKIDVKSGPFTKTENVVVYYTSDESLWGNEGDSYSRTLFVVTETQIRAKDGISGDKTALKQAETQLKMLKQDPEATQIKDIAERTVVIEEVLGKTTKAMSKEEKKKAKSDLTIVKR